eukprot:scaffold799_cov220-Pinguiococcus_pyrenoidosus.AAC.5
MRASPTEARFQISARCRCHGIWCRAGVALVVRATAGSSNHKKKLPGQAGGVQCLVPAGRPAPCDSTRGRRFSRTSRRT